jgi:putative transposase
MPRRADRHRQTFYRWRKNYGRLTEDEAQRLKRLEHARLKALIADRDLEIEVPREINARKW